MPDKQQPAILLLEDGTLCHGSAFGAIGIATGEICFNTGMTGYQEVFTDPSYYGQVLIMNSVHIGNYGVKDEDVESDSVKIRGLIGRNDTIHCTLLTNMTYQCTGINTFNTNDLIFFQIFIQITLRLFS